MVHSKSLLLLSGRQNFSRQMKSRNYSVTINTNLNSNSNSCRFFTSYSKGSNDKKKAMKRQLQKTPTITAPPTPTLPAQPSTISSNSFAAAIHNGDPILSSNRIVAPVSSTLLQAAPIPNWETDKYRLSSLPDDAASLLDKEELFDPSIHLPYSPKDWTGYESATPLSDFLMSRIGVAGRAITTAEYMRHALTHPQYGYYTNPPTSKYSNMNDDDFNEWDDHDANATTSTTTNMSTNTSTLIGPRGDFITAPEVSHVFGHCLCIWFVTQWQSKLLHRPDQVQLVEFGPGRGTLMVDILQLATTSKLQDFGEAIKVVNLIEASRALRSEQEDALRKGLGALIDFEFVHVTSSSSSNGDKDVLVAKKATSQGEKKFQIRVEWYDTFASFQKERNRDMPVFMILQEFLDALPVHTFQKTSEGWRERLINVASVEDDPPSKGQLKPRLRQVLAPDVTPAVELFLEPNPQFHTAPEGTVVEICPESLMLVEDIAKVLEENQGVSLMIDYGQDGTTDTLRAFSNHMQVPLTSFPGQVDVTADVDFFALRTAIGRRQDADVPEDRKIHAFGPVTQGEFLMRMGAADMVINSIEQDDTSPEQAQKLTEALKFLVLPEHMGEKFKVLALAPKRDGIFAPAGMEV